MCTRERVWTSSSPSLCRAGKPHLCELYPLAWMLTLPGPLSVQTNLPQIPHTFTEAQAEMINPLLLCYLTIYSFITMCCQFFFLCYMQDVFIYLFIYLFLSHLDVALLVYFGLLTCCITWARASMHELMARHSSSSFSGRKETWLHQLQQVVQVLSSSRPS